MSLQSIPIKILHEAEGHKIRCETIAGEIYHGKLIAIEDNMNFQMEAVEVTYRNGSQGTMENIYVRGSKIRFLILPDSLVKSPSMKMEGIARAPNSRRRRRRPSLRRSQRQRLVQLPGKESRKGNIAFAQKRCYPISRK